jgi:hypothetical protein
MRVSTPGRQCSMSSALLTFIALNPFVSSVLPEEQTLAFRARDNTMKGRMEYT